MLSSSNSLQRVTWDMIGIGASILCAIHCALLPFVLAFAPALSHFVPGDERVHRVLAFLLVGVGLIAFWTGYQVHRRKIVVLLLAFGIAAIVAGAYGEGWLPSHRWETAITLIGSSLLVTAHFKNRTLCRTCKVCANSADECAITKLV